MTSSTPRQFELPKPPHHDFSATLLKNLDMIRCFDDLLGRIGGLVAVVANDAGAANHIAEWLGPRKRENVYGTLGGPASVIFAERCPWLYRGDFNNFLSDCNALISGTGWASAMEHEARHLARQVGCYSIAVIDHWTGYASRFSRNGHNVLPDEIWVTDERAMQIAGVEFPSIPVVQLENTYLDRLVNEVRKNPASSAGPRRRVLYLLEPIRDAWGSQAQPGEFLALDFFASNLAVLGLDDEALIRLRPHPSDQPGKYDRWIKSNAKLDLTLDNMHSLAESLAWADVVVGCQTYAMVVALASGKQVVCSIPPGMPPCELPQHEITLLASLVS